MHRIPHLAGRILLVLLATVLIAGAAGAAPGDRASSVDRVSSGRHAPDASAPAATVPGEVVVKFAPHVAGSVKTRAVTQAQLKIKDKTRTGLVLARVTDGGSVRDAVEELKKKDGVEFAEPNYIRELSAVPNDPLFDALWGLSNVDNHDINAPQAWDRTITGDDVIVAVLDSGIDLHHPDLINNLWENPEEATGTVGIDDDPPSNPNNKIDDLNGWDYTDKDANPDDTCNGHGTHVSGTIGAERDNNVGVVGVTNNVQLVALRVATCDGLVDAFSVTKAIAYARNEGARVVSMSFGGSDFSNAEWDAIKASPNILFVAAAGNLGMNNDRNPMYPCMYSSYNVMCVGATNKTDGLASFSNFGASTVDLGAPGVGIVSTYPFEQVFEDSFEYPTSELTNTFTLSDPADWITDFYAPGKRELRDPGRYDPNDDPWIQITDPFDLTAMTDCAFSYYLEHYLEHNATGAGDWIRLEESVDGTNWTLVKRFTRDTAGPLGPYKRTMLPNADGAPEYYLRFLLETDDDEAVDDGVFIDDLLLLCSSPNPNYPAFPGTSMATPHVSGSAALIWAYRPGASVTSVKNALMMGTDKKTGLKPRLVSGGRLDLNAAMEILEPLNAHPVRVQVKTDGNDTASKLDIRQATFGNGDRVTFPSGGRSEVTMKVHTYDSWTARDLARRPNYISILFDSRGGPNADFYAFVYSANGKIKAEVWKFGRTNNIFMGNAKGISRPTSRSIKFTFPINWIQPQFADIFWLAQTRWRGSSRCTSRSGCVDNAPAPRRWAIYPL